MDYYNVKVINDVIYNDETHLVTLFKDYLIFDDISEFLKRYYRQDESSPRLRQIYKFYEQFSKVFPNYIILEESRYMFKNIERKQIAIDEKQRFFYELEGKAEKQSKARMRNLSQIFEEEDSNRMFDSNFINSVAGIDKCSEISESMPFRYVSQMYDSQMSCRQDASKMEKSNEKQKVKETPEKRIEDYEFCDLVDRFIKKDSVCGSARKVKESETDNSKSKAENVIKAFEYARQQKQNSQHLSPDEEKIVKKNPKTIIGNFIPHTMRTKSKNRYEESNGEVTQSVQGSTENLQKVGARTLNKPNIFQTIDNRQQAQAQAKDSKQKTSQFQLIQRIQTKPMPKENALQSQIIKVQAQIPKDSGIRTPISEIGNSTLKDAKSHFLKRAQVNGKIVSNKHYGMPAKTAVDKKRSYNSTKLTDYVIVNAKKTHISGSSTSRSRKVARPSSSTSGQRNFVQKNQNSRPNSSHVKKSSSKKIQKISAIDSKHSVLAVDMRFHQDHFRTQNTFKTHRTMDTHKSKKRTSENQDDFEKLFYKTISADNSQSIPNGQRTPNTARGYCVSKEVAVFAKQKQPHSRGNSYTKNRSKPQKVYQYVKSGQRAESARGDTGPNLVSPKQIRPVQSNNFIGYPQKTKKYGAKSSKEHVRRSSNPLKENISKKSISGYNSKSSRHLTHHVNSSKYAKPVHKSLKNLKTMNKVGYLRDSSSKFNSGASEKVSKPRKPNNQKHSGKDKPRGISGSFKGDCIKYPSQTSMSTSASRHQQQYYPKKRVEPPSVPEDNQNQMRMISTYYRQIQFSQQLFQLQCDLEQPRREDHSALKDQTRLLGSSTRQEPCRYKTQMTPDIILLI